MNMTRLEVASRDYSDIIDVVRSEENPGEIILIVKPDYNREDIQDFIYNHTCLGMNYKIKTES